MLSLLLFVANVTKCHYKLDLGFILDSSGSIQWQDFERMKVFVKDLTNFYKLSQEQTRVSVMSFSNSATIHFSFNAHIPDKSSFDSAVDRIQYSGGGTATARALNLARTRMFSSDYGARGSGKHRIM